MFIKFRCTKGLDVEEEYGKEREEKKTRTDHEIRAQHGVHAKSVGVLQISIWRSGSVKL